MGRGRAKAKQAKVARQLKYNSGGGTDLSRLAEELGASSTSNQSPNSDRFEDDEHDDDLYARYAELYEDDDEDDEDEDSSQHRRGA
jgi:phage terminase small subunit